MLLLLVSLFFVLLLAAGFVFKKRGVSSGQTTNVPVSVNYHFTRQCNYSCGFCFHTAKTSHMEDIDRAKQGLRLLKEAGMKKMNFAGGEPFLYPKFLGELVLYCKFELGLESVSIVSNGSKIKRQWFDKYARGLDILAISCDSFDDQTNAKIGRGQGQHLKSLQEVRNWCQEFDVRFKLNTVVCSYNWEEDMNSRVAELKPYRWKVFQVLPLEGENIEGGLRDVTPFLISKEQFQHFIEKHKENKPVPEDNETMKNSYLLMDEYMRFLDCTGNGKKPSESILDVGVAKALRDSGFDSQMFEKRGGIYDWTRIPTSPSPCSSVDPQLEW